MRRLALIAGFATGLGLILAGCATVAPLPPPPRPAPPAPRPVPAPRPALTPAPAPGTDSGPLSYRCDRGKRFTAAWNQPGDKVRVTAGGVTKALPLARSGSGARYASGPFEIWGKGESATLSGFPGGPYDNCRAG